MSLKHEEITAEIEFKVAKVYCAQDEAQLLNELKATGIEVGRLINFGREKVEFKSFVFSDSSVFHPCFIRVSPWPTGGFCRTFGSIHPRAVVCVSSSLNVRFQHLAVTQEEKFFPISLSSSLAGTTA